MSLLEKTPAEMSKKYCFLKIIFFIDAAFFKMKLLSYQYEVKYFVNLSKRFFQPQEMSIALTFH